MASATKSQISTDPIAEDKPAETENTTEQSVLAKNVMAISPSTSQDAGTTDQPKDTAAHQEPLASAAENTNAPDIYAPQARSFYYKEPPSGYDNAAGQWDEYPSYANADGMDIGSPGVFNENSSLVYHAGYGYSLQMPFGPYSPVTPPLPSLPGDAQLFSPQQYPFSAPPYYQNMGPPSMPYMTSPTQASQPDLTTLVSIDQQCDSMLYGPHPNYPAASGGNFAGNPATQNFHDYHHGFDGMRSGGLWSDWSKTSDRQGSLPPVSPAVSPQPIGPLFGQNVGMASQHQRSFYGSGSNTYNRGYFQGGYKEGSNFGNSSISGPGMSHTGWLSFDNSRRRARGGGSPCGCSGVLDLLSEQNRGPRASRPKSRALSDGPCTDNKDKSSIKPSEELNNRADFVTEYRDAKFFIIKSYSEDNVHKSVKYGVWASTPNGNKKLDAAYREAKDKEESCPVFLFFSVNASAQFCGVAEMVGPVDFEKSVDYWQQDKWSGQFPVKWHIIKDVPNSQLRHIILENNDHKPVTNSRDTQEVKLEQGIEMLNIFKKYENDTSILDDFDFYEDREKAMQEKKARQQVVTTVGVIGENEQKNAVTPPNDFVKKMSKSFAQVVRLDEGNKEGSGTEKSISVSDSSISGSMKHEDALAAAVSSAQS